jgi:hypothetical protein
MRHSFDHGIILPSRRCQNPSTSRTIIG